ncbi:hypothetical protein HPP92_018414 [Vanilla planifolia]|uniref:DUF3444 domain-containing protein n=1 Tax=Vanilla planifolia TaxID=51239 RepID=A0A835Q700_VANPL|nr:hypothetical protein HPP92_018414 [Vanilla planifolia]
MPPPGSTSSFSWSDTDHNHNNVPGQHSKNVGQTSFDIPATKPVKPVVASMHTNKSRNVGGSRGIGIVNSRDKSANPKDKPAVKPLSGSAQRRRNKRNVTSFSDSESAQIHSSDHTTYMESAYRHGGSTSSRYPRREARNQTNVIPEVDGIEDDDFVCPSKKLRKEGLYSTREQNMSSPVITTDVKAKTSETSIPTEETKGDQTGFDPSKKEVKQARARPSENSAVSTKSRSPEVKSSFTYPDPEFYDFEKDRHQSKFAANQIWAAYDTCDAMPRFYAIIKKVFTPDFKLLYTWLSTTLQVQLRKLGLMLDCQLLVVITKLERLT